MNKAVSLFLAVSVIGALMFVSVVNVSASDLLQVTNTPTPVVSPTITSVGAYFPTVAPTDASSYGCSGGTPVGWGTVTPDAMWDILCGACKPTTPLPSNTPGSALGTKIAGTATASYLTATPVPSATVTATATSTPTGYLSCYNGDARCTAISGSLLHFQGYTTGSILQVKVNDAAVNLYVQFNVRMASGSGFVGAWRNSGYPGDVWLTAGSANRVWSAPGQINVAPNLRVWAIGTYEVDLGVHIPNQYFWTLRADNANGYGFDSVSDAYVSAVPFGAPTATPTPVPYCNTVNGGGASAPDEGFEWSGITLGGTSCFDIGPYEEITIFSWLSAGNLDIPWIAHMCLTEVDIGVVQAFGVQVSLLVVSYIVGVVMVIRNLFVS